MLAQQVTSGEKELRAEVEQAVASMLELAVPWLVQHFLLCTGAVRLSRSQFHAFSILPHSFLVLCLCPMRRHSGQRRFFPHVLVVAAVLGHVQSELAHHPKACGGFSADRYSMQEPTAHSQQPNALQEIADARR